MDEKDIEEILEYIKKNYDYDTGLADWSFIKQKYNENLLLELMNRGLIYEPVFGLIRVV